MNTNDNRLKAHKLIDHIFQDLLPAHGMAQRPEQIQLSHRMLEAMQDGRIALCDAGTGIGKTYAYLAAATAASAFPTGQIARPIIISTSSIADYPQEINPRIIPKKKVFQINADEEKLQMCIRDSIYTVWIIERDLSACRF